MLRSILANWSVIAVSALAVLVSYPLLLSRLGQDTYGVWLLLTSMAGYFSILTLGVPMANVRFLAKYLANDEPEKAEAVLSTNWAFFGVIGMLTLLAGIVLSIFVPGWFAIAESTQPLILGTGILIFGEVAVRFAFESFEGTLHAKHAFVQLSLIRNAGTVVRLAGIYFFVFGDSSLLALGGVFIASTVLQSLAIWFTASRLTPMLKPNPFAFDSRVLREVLSFGATVLLMNMATRITTTTGPIIVGVVAGTAAVVPYAASSSIVFYIKELIVGICNVVMPRVSEQESRVSLEFWAEYFVSLSRKLTLFMVPVTAGLLVFGRTFLELWLGEQVAASAYYSMVALVLGIYFVAVVRGAATPILAGTSKLKEYLWVHWMVAGVSLGLGVLLAPAFGGPGVALAVAVAEILGSFAGYLVVRKLLSLNSSSFARETLYLGMPCLLLQGALGLLLQRWLCPDTYLELALAGILFISGYCIVLLFCLTASEKLAAMRFMQSFLSTSRPL